MRAILAKRRPLHGDWLIVAGLFILAALLRVWGTANALPYVNHPDEPPIVDAAVRIAKSGDLNPHMFDYPAFFLYLQAILTKLNILWGTWRGFYSGPSAIPDGNHGLALAPDLFLWGRTASGLIGAAAVAGVYGVGRAIWGRPAGLAAALLLLTSTLHIEHSHYLTTDGTMGAWGVAVVAASWGLLRHPQPRAALLAGAMVGFCTATKYNGLVVGLVPALAWLLAALGAWSARSPGGAGTTSRSRLPVGAFLRRWGGLAALTLGAAAVTYLIINPYLILDWPNASAGIFRQVNNYSPVGTLDEFMTSLTAYANALGQKDGVLVATGLLGGLLLLAASVRRGATVDRAAAWLLVPFPLIYLLLMSRFHRVFDRNMVIILPFLSLFGGYAIARVAAVVAAHWPVRRAHRRARPVLGLVRAPRMPGGDAGGPAAPAPSPRQDRRSWLLTGLFSLVVIAQPGGEAIRLNHYLITADSRNLAAAWITDQLGKGERVAAEIAPWIFCAPAPLPCRQPDVFAPNVRLTSQQPPSWYADRGYDYVLLADRSKGQLRARREESEARRALLDAYFALPVAQEFPGDQEGAKGPYILVLRVGAGPEDMVGVTPSGAQFGGVAALWGYAATPLAAMEETFDPAATPPPAQPTYAPGGVVGLRLYWRALQQGTRAPPGNWTVGIQVADASGRPVAQLDVPPNTADRIRPLREWYAQEFVDGRYNVPLPATLAPGVYHLRVILYDNPNGPSLPVTQGDGPPASSLDLGPLTIAP